MPKEQIVNLQIPILPNENENSTSKNVAIKGGKLNNPPGIGIKPATFTIPNEAQPDIKKALDVNFLIKFFDNFII